MKNLFKILILSLLLFNLLFSLGKRDDSYNLTLKNSFENYSIWNFHDSWKVLDDRYKVIKKIETYSIKEKPNHILLLFDTKESGVLMCIIKKSSADGFYNDSRHENLHSLKFEDTPIVSLYSYDNSKVSFVFDYFNGSIKGLYSNKVLLIPYYIYNNKIQFYFLCYNTSWNKISGDVFQIGGLDREFEFPYQEYFYQNELSYSFDDQLYFSSLNKFMNKKYLESSLSEFKKIFLLD